MRRQTITPALPVPYYDLDRSAWRVLDGWTPARVTLPPVPLWLN